MTAGPMLDAVPSARARAVLDAVPAVHVVVVGDVMLDHFMIGQVRRISPEAPVPVVELEREFSLPGGAANVAGNVVALGARVTLLGVAGDDAWAGDLRGLLEARGVAATGLITDPGRPTTRKTRLATTRHQQVARVDVERADDVAQEIERALVARLLPAIETADAVVVSDYLKGVITAGLMARVVAAVRARRVPLLVDPKVPHLPLYAGATLVTPNHGEAEAGTRRRIRTADDARIAARELRESLRVDGVLITLGEQGMWLTDGTGEGHLLPPPARWPT